MNRITTNFIIIVCLMVFACKVDKKNEVQDVINSEWQVDFFDDFDTFNPENWQDQMIWVNNEDQCYVPDGQFNTREVSN
ncbi:MAG: hypothetical protein JJ936_04135, partial [Psychroserpens sp.]|nr:hypothetical protein [Psychroserpens sp.]